MIDINECIQKYEEAFYNDPDSAATFYPEDVAKIAAASDGTASGLVCCALEAGFWRGYMYQQEDLRQLLEVWQALNDHGREKALERIEELRELPKYTSRKIKRFVKPKAEK